MLWVFGLRVRGTVLIVCCGEALIDMIPVRDSEGNSALRPVSGGGIFNTAIGLGRLGIATAMFTGLSDDLFGKQLVDDLGDSGVLTHLAVRSSRPTTLAFVELVDGKASYSFYDENTAGRMIQADDLPDMPAGADVFYFGGISLCSEPASTSYAVLAEQVHNSSVVMIDPNIRPGFIQDEQLYRALLQKMIGLADIVKVSDEDLEWLVKGDISESTRVEKLRLSSRSADGHPLIIVTRGEKGVCAYLSNGDEVTVDAKQVEVTDTVGAGDTFNAGVLESLQKSGVLTKSAFQKVNAQVIEKSLLRGVEVAAVTVTRVGANPPWIHELT